MNAKTNTARRVSVGVGVVALAAGMAVAGAGVASAAVVGGKVEANRMVAQQTVSSAEVATGGQVVIDTVVERKLDFRALGVDNYYIAYLHEQKDLLDGCFERVDTQVRYDGEIKSDWVINSAGWVDQGGEGSGAGWTIASTAYGPFHTVKVSSTYDVTCDPGTYEVGVGVAGVSGRESYPGTGPTITVTEAAPAEITGLAVTPASPNAAEKVTVSGKTSPNTGVTVKIGDREFTGDSDASGEFAVETDKFAAGRHTATVTASNTAGSTSGTVSFTVTAAPTKPAAPSGVKVSPQPVHPGDTVTVTGKARANSTVEVDLGGQTCSATADGNGDFSCQLTAPGAGKQQLTVTATNAQGTSDPYTANITVSEKPTPGQPTVTIDPSNPQDGDVVNVTVTAPEGAAGKTVSVKINGQEICQNVVTGADGKATCASAPSGPGQYTVVVDVEGAEQYTTSFVILEPDTGQPDDGDDGDNGGGNEGGTDSGSGSGSLGFFSSLDLFGSLGLK